jgi:hypothetical protein
MDDFFMLHGWTGDGPWMILLCTVDGPGMEYDDTFLKRG